MAVNWVLPVRVVQAVLSLVVLGLMAYVASWWSTHWRQFSPHEINFLIFTPIWSLLSLLALILLHPPSPSSPLNSKFTLLSSNPGVKYGLVGLQVLTMLYWFGGFVALAVFLTDRICFGTVCSVAKAGVAVSGASWAAWAATSVWAVVVAVREWRMGRVMQGKVEMHQGV